MKTITVLGNNSGRNAGDNAILGNLLDDFARERTDILFQVPTLSPAFIRRHFGHHPVHPMGMMPWNLAIKNFGWPLYRSMTNTHMVLVTDNILFDRKFHNPLVNYLKSIALFAPYSRKKNIPIVLYNASVGPIDQEVGRQALQQVLDGSPLVISRDEQTRELIERLCPHHPEIKVHADCALNTAIPSASRLQEIISKEDLFRNPKGTIGLNINAYIDTWRGDGKLGSQDFHAIIAGTADRLIEELDVDILFTVSQVMDMKSTLSCMQKIRRQDRVRVVGNDRYTYQELAGLLSRLEVHAGLRTHTLIFCAAVGTPMINIEAYPKSAGFLRTIGMKDWNISLDGITVENLSGIIKKAWTEREGLRQMLRPIVDQEKKKARASVGLVSKILDAS
ncbi:MAG: polysaccharide pyruvyl transferase family protein [Desulfobulbaceae bacterium]